jgi:hypothetical protein
VIRWQDLDPSRVERAIQMLIPRVYPGCRPIDGSGGDDGRDVRWDSPDGLVIFEIKSYTKRLTPGQRKEVQDSLANAARHHPVRWFLVIPRNHTPAEERWFDGLRVRYSGIKLEWLGRSWLDSEFADRPDFVRYVEGPLYVLAERAKQFGDERAVLANGISDVIARQQALRGLTDDISIHCRG